MGAGAGVGAGVLGVVWGDMSTTLSPVVVVREQEGYSGRLTERVQPISLLENQSYREVLHHWLIEPLLFS
jgi:hypothetical protein